MKELPLGIQTFEKIRKDPEKYIYIDKTKEIAAIAKKETPCFLSRPRRFGKSLTCSTIQALFEGKKELFKNLWIAGEGRWKWEEHPVVYLNFAEIDHKTYERLEISICKTLKLIAKKYKFVINDDIPGDALVELIEFLSKKNSVVIIVDEYDKPILDHINDISTAEKIRATLSSFYGVIKNIDRHLRYIFITGVTKFSKTSIFSGINNLYDLTYSEEGATLCGYTHAELVTNFSDHIEAFAQEGEETSSEEIINKLREWYNGYKFSDKSFKDQKKHIYNPFSILNVLKTKRFKNFWFESGTPRFLIDLLKKEEYPIINLNQEVQLAESELGSFEIDDLPLIPLLLQTGYMTLASYNKSSTNYTLGFPNHEVHFSFLRFIVKLISTIKAATFNNFINNFRKELTAGDIESFCHRLKFFFTQIPYVIHINEEKYFQSMFYVVVNMLGAKIQVEIPTNVGRIDALIETKNDVFLFEFKFKKTPEKALDQIKEKKYFEPYMSINKPITLIGLTFDLKKKNISSDWIIEKINK